MRVFSGLGIGVLVGTACVTIGAADAAPLYDMRMFLPLANGQGKSGSGGVSTTRPAPAADRWAAPARPPASSRPASRAVPPRQAASEPPAPVSRPTPAAAPEPGRKGRIERRYIMINGTGSYLTAMDSGSTSNTILTKRKGESYAAGLAIAAGQTFDVWGEPIRFELETGVRTGGEFSYRTKIAGTDYGYDLPITSALLMINGYVDYDLGDWTPYWGLGLGGAYHIIDSERCDQAATQSCTGKEASAVTPAASIMGGTRYWLDDAWALHAGLRLTYLGNVETETFGSGESVSVDGLYSADLVLGVGYGF